jgi:hypothetical protein
MRISTFQGWWQDGHGDHDGHTWSWTQPYETKAKVYAYGTPTGRWHCGVWSVLQRVRSLFRCALLRLDQRVRSVTGPARLVVFRASGPRDERVRSVLREVGAV